jgi:hypothetical protein
MFGSLLAALALVGVVVAAVTWRIGPAGLDSESRDEAVEEHSKESQDDDGRRGRSRGGRD